MAAVFPLVISACAAQPFAPCCVDKFDKPCCPKRPQEPFRTHHDFKKKKNFLRTLAIVTPQTRVILKTAGGIEEVEDEGSRETAESLVGAVQEVLSKRPRLKTVVLSGEGFSERQRDIYDQSLKLFDRVNGAIYQHTYDYGSGDNLFVKKIARFDYSLGSEVHEIAGEADALLFIWGYDYSATRGNIAVETVKVLTLQDFFRGFAGDNRAVTVLTAALVDPVNGAILWYAIETPYEIYLDLRRDDDAKQVVKKLLKYLPK